MSYQATPAGWYPDPDGTGGRRFWDGSAWTEHRQAAAAPPAAPSPRTPEQRRRFRWMLLVVGLVVVVGLAIAIPIRRENDRRSARRKCAAAYAVIDARIRDPGEAPDDSSTFRDQWIAKCIQLGPPYGP